MLTVRKHRCRNPLVLKESHLCKFTHDVMGPALGSTAFPAPGHQLSGISEGHFHKPLYPILEHLLSEKEVAKTSNNRNALLVPVLGTEHWQVCQHPQHGVFHLCFHFCCSLQKVNPCNTRNAHFFKNPVTLEIGIFHVSVSESCRLKICVFCTSGLHPLHSHRYSHLGLTSHRVPP